ncbi:MAG: bifunctional DNA-formamidopyrimidine glycosylase/DNA-(apurinic or apyrimidinic site) lyase [Planctomycetes bacterium]|nr:bifunctional DNA-formamidopyrimidine glycosylase/DNA-(apurinic or apyrimidinic site) lyase [Planctomycetota bacterium]
MPELPEVETVVRDLRGPLVGKRLAGVRTSRKKLRRLWSPKWNRAVAGHTVCSLSRRGKWILIDLDGPQLLIHLGMTGQLMVVPSRKARQDHTHLVFALDDGTEELRFRDVRRFGCATLLADRSALMRFFQDAKLGPEPFELDPVFWRKCLQHTRRNLKAILLDQRVVAGVGNIYADETIFEARLHPRLLGQELSRQQAERLRMAIVVVLRRAIEKRGSSIRNYVGGSGLKGEYQNEFRVYGRTGKACVRCRKPIERIVLAGRATHFCPQCQKARRRKTAV